MIYALEWYDVPKKDYGYRVEYHPYLTKGDHLRLEQLNTEYQMYEGVTLVLCSLISNRFLLNLKQKFLQKYMTQRWLRAPCALALGGIATMSFHALVMKEIYLNDLKDMGMDQYFELDLDADMMKQDLGEMGIEIEARYFDSKQPVA